jgi:MSHA biogenesis protein MshP
VKSQCGFLLVTAIFLLVVLASLGAFILTISGTQQTSSALDVQGARAYQAARAGIDWASYQLIQTGTIAFDAAANSPLLSNLTSGSWSHTTGGTNRYLVVGLSGYDLSDSTASVTVTYAGVPMTKLGGLQNVNDDNVVLWGLVNPALGTNTVQVSNIPANYSQLGGGSVSFTGVHQTTPTGTLASTPFPTTGTVNITLANGDMGVDILYSSGNPVGTPPSPGAGETARTSQTTGGSTYFRMGTEAGSGTVTMNWTGGSATDNAIAAIPIKTVAAFASACNPGPTTQNVTGMGGTLSGFTAAVTCSSATYTEGGATWTVYQITSTGAVGTVGTLDRVERQLQATLIK